MAMEIDELRRTAPARSNDHDDQIQQEFRAWLCKHVATTQKDRSPGKVSMVRLAADTGLSMNTVRSLYYGQRKFTLPVMVRIADYLGYSVRVVRTRKVEGDGHK